MYKNLIAATFFSVAGNVAFAETIQQYAQSCIAELGLQSIPGFSCQSGIDVPGIDGGT